MVLRRLTVLASVLMVALFLQGTVYGAGSLNKIFINNSGASRDSLYIYLNLTINPATEVSANVSPFTVKAIKDDSVVILKGGSIANGDSTVCIVFAIASDTLKIRSAKWDNSITLAASDTLRCGSTVTNRTPFLGTTGIVVLLLLLAATAWFVLSRRKVRTTGSAA